MRRGVENRFLIAVVLLSLVLAASFAFSQKYAQAAFFMTIAIFIRVGVKRL